MSYIYKIPGWEIPYPDNRIIIFSYLFSFRHPGCGLWDLWLDCVGYVVVWGWTGEMLFHTIIPYDCDIYVGESKPAYSSVIHSFTITHIIHYPSWELVFISPWELCLVFHRALPAHLCFVFLSLYVWCMTGMDPACYTSDMNVLAKKGYLRSHWSLRWLVQSSMFVGMFMSVF